MLPQHLAPALLGLLPFTAATHLPRLEPLARAAPPGITYYQPSRLATRNTSPPTKLEITPYTQRLQALRGTTNPKSAAAILGMHQRQVGGYGYQNITSTTAYGTQYATEVLWDGVPVSLILDTASADTWAVASTFHCLDYAGYDLPQAACGFGASLDPAFADTGTDDGGLYPPQHMYVRYGDGRTVDGPMGYADIGIANLTVARQQVCLANNTYWQGNNVTSGLLGLAFPSLTSAYAGPDSADHSAYEWIEYPPLFTSMADQGLIEPIFSVAISRNSSDGILAFGGVPYVTGLDYSTVAYMDILITKLDDDRPNTAYEPSYWTVVPSGWKWGPNTDLEQEPYIVDTGTTITYVPERIATAINNLFNPPAVFLWMYGAYFTSCTATAPVVAVVLNNTPFYFNPVDLIYRKLRDPLTGLCMTGIANGGSGPYILGASFLQNALVTFDIKKSQVRFTGRQFY